MINGDHLKLLYIEDNPGDARLVNDMLVGPNRNAKYALSWVQEIKEGLTLLEEETFQLILLDFSLPDSRGIESLHTLARTRPEIPIIVLTDMTDLDISTRAAQAGAQDYLVKGQFDVYLLERVILYSIERKNAETVNQKRATQLSLLHEISAEVAGLLDLKSVLDTTARLVLEKFKYHLVCIFLIEDESLNLQLVSAVTPMLDYESVGKIVDCREGLVGWSVTNQQTVWAPDVARDKRYIACTKENDATRSELVIPIWVDGKVAGVFDVQSAQTNAIDANERQVLEALANQLATAIKNARLYGSVQRELAARLAMESQMKDRLQELDTLHKTTSGLATLSFGLEASLDVIVRSALELIKCTGSSLYLFRDDDQQLEAVYATGSGVPLGSRLVLGEGLAGRVAQSREPMIVEHYSEWENRSRQFDSLKINSVMAVPMVFQNELLGVMTMSVLENNARQLTIADTRLLGLFAGQAALVLHNAHLFEETNHRLRELEAINDISSSVRAAHSLNEMLTLLLEKILNVLEAPLGGIWLFDRDVNALKRVVKKGEISYMKRELIPPNDGIIGSVYTTGKPFITCRQPEIQPGDAVESGLIGEWSMIAIPILSEELVIGVLAAGVQGKESRLINQVRLLTTLLDIAGNAITRMRLHEQTERRMENILALRSVDQAISSSFDIDVTLHIILEQTTHQLGVDAATVLRYNQHLHTLDYIAGVGFITEGIHQTHQAIGLGVAGRIPLDRLPVFIANLPEKGTAFKRQSLLADEGFIAYYGLPLVARGGLKGVLELYTRRPLELNSEWEGLVEMLAGQAAIAIDNSELFNNLQRSNLELAMAYETTLEGWSRALDMRDKETEGHTRRVMEMTVELAQRMRIHPDDMVHIRRGALLHDIGKISIPDNILLKPGPLTGDEWQVMRQHPVFARNLLYPIPYLRPSIVIPYGHHERWNGNGYPLGLKAEEIPLAARIFAVVDVYDALTSNRPYRQAWSVDNALDYIREMSQVLFDPNVVTMFLEGII